MNWGNSGHHALFHERDSERGPDCFPVRVVTDPVPVDPFAVIIGDVLHNMRSTLDHIAYALAATHTRPLPDDIAKESEFPIYRYESNQLARRIRGIHPDAQAILKTLQPYNRGDDFASHPLWALYELSNIDKHRLLLVGAVGSLAAGFSPDLFRNCLLGDVDVYGGIIESEAIVVRYRAVPKDPSKEMHVEFDPLLQIIFNCGSTVKGKGVISTLATAHKYIIDDVIPALQPFL